jgi:hypothetical protein
MDAALIILSLGGDAVLSPSNPYRGSRSEFGDITFGSKNLLSLLAQASLLAQKTSYYYKWQVHRRARPETVGGRIEVQLTGRKSYDLDPGILACDGLARTKSAFGSWLLPQAYPEGCPTHPSYPAAHAVNAGACTTVLKAFFDQDFIIADPVEATADGARLEPGAARRSRWVARLTSSQPISLSPVTRRACTSARTAFVGFRSAKQPQSACWLTAAGPIMNGSTDLF